MFLPSSQGEVQYRDQATLPCTERGAPQLTAFRSGSVAALNARLPRVQSFAIRCAEIVNPWRATMSPACSMPLCAFATQRATKARAVRAIKAARSSSGSAQL